MVEDVMFTFYNRFCRILKFAYPKFFVFLYLILNFTKWRNVDVIVRKSKDYSAYAWAGFKNRENMETVIDDIQNKEN